MDEIIKLRNLHGEVLGLFDKISLLLNTERMEKNAITIRSLLSSLKVYLQIIFSIEQRIFFPILLNYDDTTTKSKALCFIADMEEIKDIYYRYNEKWVRTDLIQKDPENFIKETRSIFDKFFRVFTKEKRFIRLISEVSEQIINEGKEQRENIVS